MTENNDQALPADTLGFLGIDGKGESYDATERTRFGRIEGDATRPGPWKRPRAALPSLRTDVGSFADGAYVFPTEPRRFEADRYDEETERMNKARFDASVQMLMGTDVSRLDDAGATALYRSVTKGMWGFSDEDGRQLFGSRAGDAHHNIDLLRRFIKGERRLIQDPEYEQWTKLDEEGKFRYALEHETTRTKVKSFMKGERGAGFLDVLGAIGAGSAENYAFMSDRSAEHVRKEESETARRLDYDRLNDDEKAAYRADVIRDYDEKLSRKQVLQTFLQFSNGLSDRAGHLLAKSFAGGNLDAEIETLPEEERDRVYTAFSLMRGDQKKGHILGIPTDFTDDTVMNRVQLGLYGFQQGVLGLVTDTVDFAKDVGMTVYAKTALDETERADFYRWWNAQARIEQAMKQGLPEADTFIGEAWQSLWENAHWFIPYGAIGKGGKMMKVARGAKGLAEEKKILEAGKAAAEAGAAAVRANWTLDVNGVKKLGDYGKALLARQMNAVSRYTEGLKAVEKELEGATWVKDAAGAGMKTAGMASAYSAFAKEYLENADAAGISREESVTTAAVVGLINAWVEHFYVPGLESSLSPAQVKSLMFRSLVQAVRSDGCAGFRKWIANRVEKGVVEGGKVAATEGLVEEPLQQLAQGHGKAFDAMCQKLRENGHADVADQIAALGKSFMATLPEDLGTFIDTAVDMVPSAVGFGVRATGNMTARQHLHNVFRRWQNRKSGTTMSTARTMDELMGARDYDAGVVDVIQRSLETRKAVEDYWKGNPAAEGERRPRGVAEAFTAARQALRDPKTGDVVREVADAAGVDVKTAEVLTQYLAVEEEARAFSPNVRAYADLNLSLADVNEETIRTVLPGYVEGSFVADREKGVYAGRVRMDDGTERTIAYRVGDISADLARMAIEEAKVGSDLGASFDARQAEAGSDVTWASLSDAQRYQYALYNSNGYLGNSGVFELTDAKGQTVRVSADAVINLSNGHAADIGYAPGLPAATQATVRHETFHAIWRFIRSTLEDADVKRLADKLGVDTTDANWEAKLDEAMAHQMERYASGHYVSHTISTKFDRMLDGWAGKMVNFFGQFGARDEVTDAKAGERYRLRGFYDRVLRGEFGSGALGVELRKLPPKPNAPAPGATPAGNASANEIPVAVTDADRAAHERAAEAAAAEETKSEPEETSAQTPAAEPTETPAATAENPADASVPNQVYYRIGLPNSEVKVVGRLKVVDAETGLTTSTDEGYHDRGNQNRDDGSEESRALVQKIGANPDPLQIGTVQPVASNGVAWVLPNGDVIIGNHRMNGVRLAYEKGTAGALEAFTREDAARRGIEIPDGVTKPVLVFELVRIESPDGKTDEHEVVRLANESQNRGFNVREQAGNDAKVMVDNDLLPKIVFRADGRIDDTKSGEAIGVFRRETNAQGMIAEDGSLTEEGQTRMQNATLAALLGGQGNAALLGKLMANAGRLDVRTTLRALMKAAPELMELARTKPGYDLRGPIAEALQLYTEWRDADETARLEKGKSRRDWREEKDGKRVRGITWEAFKGQGDMFRTPSKEALILGDLFAKAESLRSFDREDVESEAGKKRVVDLVTGYLSDYVRNANAVNTETDDLFGSAPATRAEVMDAQRGTRFSVSPTLREDVEKALGRGMKKFDEVRLCSSPDVFPAIGIPAGDVFTFATKIRKIGDRKHHLTADDIVAGVVGLNDPLFIIRDTASSVIIFPGMTAQNRDGDMSDVVEPVYLEYDGKAQHYMASMYALDKLDKITGLLRKPGAFVYSKYKKDALVVASSDAPGMTPDLVRLVTSEGDWSKVITKNDIAQGGAFDSSNPDVRFSTVGGGSLVALHNLSERNLRDALDLGGFPMPSIAVTKPALAHEGYGDITLIFGRDTVDPQANRDNHVYSGDAWTPTFPHIRHKPSEKVVEKLSEKYHRLNRTSHEDAEALYNFTYSDAAADELSRVRGEDELIERLKDNAGMMRAYLADVGTPVAPVKTVDVKRLDDGTIRQYDAIAERFGVERLRELAESKEKDLGTVRELLDAEVESLDARFDPEKAERLKKLYRDNLESHSPFRLTMRADSLARAILDYREKGPETRTERYDAAATLEAARKATDPEAYGRWLHENFGGIIEKSGIRNQKDLFTSSGNRRKWESLHDPVTLANVVSVMRGEDQRNGGMFNSGNITVAAQKEFRSVDDIHGSEEALAVEGDEAHKAKGEEFTSRFRDIRNKVQSLSSGGNPFMVDDDIKKVLTEAVMKHGANAERIQTYVEREYKGWAKAGENVGADLAKLVKDIRSELKTGYFEAKPRRAVGFNEVQAAFVSESVDPELVRRLRDAGVRDVVTYGADEGARHAAVERYANDHDGVRFSTAAPLVDAMMEKNGDDARDFRFSLVHAGDIAARSQAAFDENRDALHFGADVLAKAFADTRVMVDTMLPFLDILNNNGRRYLPEEILGKTLVGNSSYGGKSVDNTTIYTRTLSYIDFTNEVKKKLGRPLTMRESFLASQMLYDIAKDPQCLYCYVSLDRKAYDEFLLRYLNERDAVLGKYRAGAKDKIARAKLYKEYLGARKDTKPQRDRFNNWLDIVDKGARLLSPADVTTEELRDQGRTDPELAWQVKDIEAYAKSASWAKKIVQYRSYNGEILKLKPTLVKKLNRNYGLRFYSFSEYSPAFIVENMQQIMDASLRGLCGLGYTKEVDFARIFAPTGMNLNISCFGSMNSDGTVLMDTRQGADWEEVKKLRERYPNVGAVFVATDDKMVEWALEQDWIDVIIPFHTVRMGTDIADFYKWVDHKAIQEDKPTEKGNKAKSITPPEHHNDRATFLRLCEERGLTPRFSKWIGHRNYMRLVNETRCPNSEAAPLKPVFDLEAAKDSFARFVEEGGYYGDWFVDGVNYEASVDQVVADIKAGREANQVPYGRQDLDVDAAARRRQVPRVHGKRFSTVARGFKFPSLMNTLSDDELVATAIASRIARGKSDKVSDRSVKLKTVKRLMERVHPNWDSKKMAVESQRVTLNALKLAKQIRADLDRGVSESLVLEHLPEAARATFGAEMREAQRQGAKLGAFGARVNREIKERQARLIEDAVRIQTGLDAGALENAYGIDLADTMMKIKKNPLKEKPVEKPAESEDGSVGAADEEETGTQLPEQDVDAAVRAAVEDIVTASGDEAKADLANRAERSRMAGRDAENAKAAAEETAEGGEPDFDPEGDAVAAAVRKHGLDLESPRHLARFVVELARRRWCEDHHLAKDAEVWHDLVAVQFLRKTAASVYSKLVRDLTYSRGRETAMAHIAKFEHAPTVAGLVSEMEFVGAVINRRRITETQKEKCEKLDLFLREQFGAQGRFRPDREELRRKVSAEAELRARYMRHAMWLTPRAAMDEAAELQKDLDALGVEFDQAGRQKDQSRELVEFDQAGRQKDQSRELVETLRKLSILREFGALRYKPLGEIDAAAEYWENLARGSGEDILRQIADRDIRTEKAAHLLAVAFADPNRVTAREGNGFKEFLNKFLSGHMGFIPLLEDMMRHASDEDRETALAILDWLQLEIQKGGDRAAAEKRRHNDAFSGAVEACYERKFNDVMKEMLREDERFLPFMGEVAGKRVVPTKARAMQLLVSLLQEGRKVEVTDEDGTTHEEWVNGYHDNIVAHHREGQAEQLMALMTPADLNMIKWLGDWYEANRQELSQVCDSLFGIGVYAELPNYFPVKMMLEEQGLEKGSAVGWSIFPKALTPRVRNSRDFDTSADIFSMWAARMEEGAQWKNHAKLGLEMRGIFGRAELQASVVANHGANVNKLMQGFITDILAGHGAVDLTSGGMQTPIDTIRGWTALCALGGNVGVMFKQTTSIPAFGFEIGLVDTARHMASAFTEEGVRAMGTIWDSEQRKTRWQVGNSEAVANALRQRDASLLKRLLQQSMILNKIGDAVPALVVGQGIYRDCLAQGMGEEDAMAKTWAIIERTQQSSRIENQIELNRRSKAMRAFFQFQSTQQQYLQYELKAIRDVAAKPGDGKRWGKLGTVLLLNHFILPSAYFWVGELYKACLGQEPPEDELKDWMIACLTGPYSALFVVGLCCKTTLDNVIKGYSYGRAGVNLPMLQWADKTLIKNPGRVLDGVRSAIFETNGKTWDDVLGSAMKWITSANATVRDLNKLYRFRVKGEKQGK